MAYKSEMARARGEKRQAEAAERRALKFKMDRYNSLSNRSRSKPGDFTYNGEKTEHDIVQELDATIHASRQTHKRKSFVDKMMADIISPEVKEYWQQRIGRGGIKF
jgi:hypothetical protein